MRASGASEDRGAIGRRVKVGQHIGRGVSNWAVRGRREESPIRGEAKTDPVARFMPAKEPCEPLLPCCPQLQRAILSTGRKQVAFRCKREREHAGGVATVGIKQFGRRDRPKL